MASSYHESKISENHTGLGSNKGQTGRLDIGQMDSGNPYARLQHWHGQTVACLS